MKPSEQELDEIGRVMHETWSASQRAQRFHGPDVRCTECDIFAQTALGGKCSKFHTDLIPWEQLSEKQKDINRHAVDAFIERGLLIPRAEHEAALAAVVEQAALLVRENDVLEREALSEAILSLATPAQQDALRKLQKESYIQGREAASLNVDARIADAVDKALDRLLLLWSVSNKGPGEVLREAIDKVKNRRRDADKNCVAQDD